MKEHVSYSPTGQIACGKSGRAGQSKGIVTGLSPKRFAEVDENNRCKRCQAIYMARGS